MRNQLSSTIPSCQAWERGLDVGQLGRQLSPSHSDHTPRLLVHGGAHEVDGSQELGGALGVRVEPGGPPVQQTAHHVQVSPQDCAVEWRTMKVIQRPQSTPTGLMIHAIQHKLYEVQLAQLTEAVQETTPPDHDIVGGRGERRTGKGRGRWAEQDEGDHSCGQTDI